VQSQERCEWAGFRAPTCLLHLHLLRTLVDNDVSRRDFQEGGAGKQGAQRRHGAGDDHKLQQRAVHVDNLNKQPHTIHQRAAKTNSMPRYRIELEHITTGVSCGCQEEGNRRSPQITGARLNTSM
jgi:hypothetical protein